MILSGRLYCGIALLILPSLAWVVPADSLSCLVLEYPPCVVPSLYGPYVKRQSCDSQRWILYAPCDGGSSGIADNASMSMMNTAIANWFNNDYWVPKDCVSSVIHGVCRVNPVSR